MFQTRRELQEKINNLKRELQNLRGELQTEQIKTRRSSLIDTAKLPQCKGLYCRKCIYAVYSGPGGIVGDTLLGCGKGAGCDDFTPTKETKENHDSSLASLKFCPNCYKMY